MISPENVINIIQQLTSPEGCPWDKEQTPHTLGDYLIEETFELVEAMRSNDFEGVKEEMGDVFFLLFFVSELMEGDTQTFLQEVWENNAQKMIRRHPHVFDNEQVNDMGEIHKKWEEIKKQEKEKSAAKNNLDNPFESIPASLPPLVKAYRLNAKAEKAGFTWPGNNEQENALQQEWKEWLAALKQGSCQQKEEEFGDLLFSLVEHGRRHGIKSNSALQLANTKFLDRIQAMLDIARERGQNWQSLDLEEKNKLWEEVKRGEK